MEVKKIFNKISGQPESYNRKTNYTFGRTLGAGSFGIVRYARNIELGQDVAVKIILKKALKGKDDIVQHELEFLQQLKHPHIVGFVDWFESREKFYIVTQLATGGELFDRIVQQGRFTEHDASQVVLQILDAISYLHKQDIVHRDIKPENVLYLDETANSNIVLADFGIAKKLQDPNEKLKSSAGSFGYAAPEVIIGTGHGKPCDIWSLGVVTYTILCGYSPFRSENVTDFVNEVKHNNAVIFHADYWREVSKDARRFIIKALQYNPDNRATADQLLNDPWLVSVASEHRNADLLPNLKHHFDGKKKFRQVIEMVKLQNKIQELKQMQGEGDDDPNEINLFGEGGGVIEETSFMKEESVSSGRSSARNSLKSSLGNDPLKSSPRNSPRNSLKSSLGNDSSNDDSFSKWKDLTKALNDVESDTSKGKTSVASSAFQQLVQAARENKQRVAEYDESTK